MQIFQWLLKLAKEQSREASWTSHDSALTNGDSNSKDIVPSRASNESKRGKQGKQSNNSKSFRPLKLLCRRDVAKACFDSTLSLIRLSSFNSSRSSPRRRRRRRRKKEFMMKIKQEQVMISKRFGVSSETDWTFNKVLPVTEAPWVRNSATVHGVDAKEKVNNKEETKIKATISRMKELVRWSSASKSDKVRRLRGNEVLRRKQQLKDNSELNNESSKISLTWDNKSCLNLSPNCSEMSSNSSIRNCPQHTVSLNSMLYNCSTRTGNWITTDSEFVVLEL